MRWVWPILLLLLALAAPANAALLADQPYSIDDNGRLITTATINGRGTYTFLIDSGCSHSLIYDHVRARLGLAASSPAQIDVYAINQMTRATPVTIDQLGIGNIALTAMTLGVLPDTPNTEGEPDGILGVDVLSRFLVVLDRAHMRLRLETVDSDTSRFQYWTQLTLEPHAANGLTTPFWFIRTNFNHVSFLTLFDLGASVTMLNWQAAEKLGLHQSDFAGQGAPPDAVRDVLGTDSPAVRLQGLSINARGEAWDRQYALVSNSSVFERFNLKDQPAAIVGPGLLRNNSLVIDFAHGRLFVGSEVNDIIARTHVGAEDVLALPS